jgi:hypothetical protein
MERCRNSCSCFNYILTDGFYFSKKGTLVNTQDNKQLYIFLGLWCAVVALLFAQASGKINLSWLHFPKAKGMLMLVQEGYKKYNFVGLREEVYALPQTSQFIHPNRTRKMAKAGHFVAHSIEEAQRMVDAGTQDIQPRLELKQKDVNGFNIYALDTNFFVVPAMHEESGAPLPVGKAYSEQLAGNTLEEALNFANTHAPKDN